MNFRIIFMVIMIISYKIVFAQCNCGSSVSMVTYGESGGSKINLNKKQLLTELYSDLRTFSHNHDSHSHTHDTNIPHDHSTHEELYSSVISSVGLRYGFTERFTLLFQQTFLSHNTSLKNITGFGDAMLGGLIKITEVNSFSVSALGAIRLPFGKKVDSGTTENLFLGSGSFDPIAGMVVVKSFSKSFIRVNVNYRHALQGFDNRYYGNFFNHGLLFGYSFKGDTKICNKTIKENNNKLASMAFINLTGENFGRQKLNNEIIDNTGGYILLGEMGMQIGYKNLFIPISISMPIYQKYFGEQNNTNFRFRAGLILTI